MAKMGRPPFELSDKDFERLVNMARIQCTQEEVCHVFGVTDKTLNQALKRRGEGTFSDIYKRHSHEGRASLRRYQWKAAENGNPTMLIWLGKQMLGQRDQIVQDNTSSDGSMTPAAPLSVEELRKEVKRRGLRDDIIED